MKRLLFLCLMLPLIAFGQAPYQRNAATTNNPAKMVNLLPSNTNPLYPLMTLLPDGSGTDRTIHYAPNFHMDNGVGNFDGNLQLNALAGGGILGLSGGKQAYQITIGSGLSFVGGTLSNTAPSGDVTNTYNTIITTNLTVLNSISVSNISVTNITVQNNLTVSNFYTVNGKNNTLIVTNALTPQQIGASKLAGTDSSGNLTNVTLAGDVTTSSGGLTTTIANNAVTLAKMVNATVTQRVLGRNTAGSGNWEEVTSSQIHDWIGSTRGSVLYRGASGWAILTPNTAGYVLTDGGVGADPAWAAAAGGGGAGVNTHVTTLAWSGTNITGFNCVTNGESFYLLVTNNCLFGTSTFSNLPAKTSYQTYTLCMQMDGTGGYVVSFTNSVADWTDGVMPIIKTNANAVSYVYWHNSLATNSLLVGTPNIDVRNIPR